MTILSLAVYTKGKNGVLLFSRQFMPIQKTRIDAILFAFPKLNYILSYEGSTYIDSDSVRYVFYQAFDVIFVLVTSKMSNFVQSTTLLHLISRLIHETCFPDAGPQFSGTSLTPDLFKQYLFDIYLLLDEVITYGGYPSEIGPTVESIQTTLQMDSHEEHRYNLQQAGKLKEAKLKSSQKAAELDRNRKFGPTTSGDPELDSRIVGIGSGSMSSSSQHHNNHTNNQNNNGDDIYQHYPNQYERNSSDSPNDSSHTRSAKDTSINSLVGFDGSKLSFTSASTSQSYNSSSNNTIGARKLGKGKMVLGKKVLGEERSLNAEEQLAEQQLRQSSQQDHTPAAHSAQYHNTSNKQHVNASHHQQPMYNDADVPLKAEEQNENAW